MPKLMIHNAEVAQLAELERQYDTLSEATHDAESRDAWECANAALDAWLNENSATMTRLLTSTKNFNDNEVTK